MVILGLGFWVLRWLVGFGLESFFFFVVLRRSVVKEYGCLLFRRKMCLKKFFRGCFCVYGFYCVLGLCWFCLVFGGFLRFFKVVSLCARCFIFIGLLYDEDIWFSFLEERRDLFKVIR